ncbi:DUF4168 domain-containing protein [Roseofilum casamattae]|uniref:DUF4168 domain-containing protein n=1 Tax=Roseofilum casamattae BLCC-M143 TaxID=3022442 RepID=A0ABT7C0N1_9CYAN|nr:DUF4168 domain-containing protein [Roseofilum casamattae]MDJ1185010.1 DUF4168 domain-containing protein [Roseofilum casamattae BLCC-M143]
MVLRVLERLNQFNQNIRWGGYGTIAAFAIATLALTGCGSGAEDATETPDETVAPVTVTPEEVQNYATAILEIEPAREVALGRVQTLMEDGVAPIVTCNQPESLKELSNEAREAIVTFCTQAREIGASYGFTPARFNAITSNLPADATLKEQVTQALIQQQTREAP